MRHEVGQPDESLDLFRFERDDVREAFDSRVPVAARVVEVGELKAGGDVSFVTFERGGERSARLLGIASRQELNALFVSRLRVARHAPGRGGG